MVNKKIVKLHLDEENFPMLFQVEKENLGDLVYDIFEYGYRCYFPKDGTSKIDSQDVHIGQIRRDLEKVGDVNEKIDRFSQVLEEMIGIKNNSSRKGSFSEDMIYRMIRNRFKDFTIEETRHLPHHGDAVISMPRTNRIERIMIEIKNYSKTVDKDEVEKLVYDMKHTGIKYCLFVSFRSGFVGRRDMTIEEFKHHGETYKIVYVPFLDGEISKIEFGIMLLERLIDYEHKTDSQKGELTWLMNSITDHLSQLDTEYSNFVKLKAQYQKMEKSIKQHLSEFYLNIRNYEIELKNSINRIWREVQRDFNSAENELIASDELNQLTCDMKKKRSQRNLGLLFELLIKYGYYPEKTQEQKLWKIIYRDQIVGSVMRDPTNIQLILFDPHLTYQLSSREIATEDLVRLDTILGSLRE